MPTDTGEDEPDEHRRYSGYRRDLAQVRPEHELDLVRTVLLDTDSAMAQSAIAEHLNHRAAQLLDDPEFSTWAHDFAPLISDWEFLTLRLREWTLLRSITTDQSWTPEEILAASDWLQRKVTEIVSTPAALAVLVAGGRTRRVRAAAARRIAGPDG